MARKEERKQRAEEIFDLPMVQAIFMSGAEWTDKTMIEKACEWLEETLSVCYYVWHDEAMCGAGVTDKFINDFKKAMMEE